jgi:hypothetical protein
MGSNQDAGWILIFCGLAILALLTLVLMSLLQGK